MLVKTQGFAILLKIIASAAPILVSVFAFLTFVAQGHELTVGIAFTVRFFDVVPRLSDNRFAVNSLVWNDKASYLHCGPGLY